MWNTLWRREMHKEFRLQKKRKGKRPLEKTTHRQKDNTKTHVKEVGWDLTGMIWLVMRTNGALLWTWWWTFEFHKIRGIYWLADQRNLCFWRTLFHGASSFVDRHSTDRKVKTFRCQLFPLHRQSQPDSSSLTIADSASSKLIHYSRNTCSKKE